MKKIVIAIDGFSSCGKSTMAKALARNIGYLYFDSGAMYRAVALYCMQNGIIANGEIDIERLRAAMDNIKISFGTDEDTKAQITFLNGTNVENEIRSLEVSQQVSRVAALDFVRTALIDQQREMGKAKGVILDGRDIGTVVFPDAELKVFVTASAEIRAQRRYDELTAKGEQCNYDEILKNVLERDYIDSHREISPLTKAEDAIVLDNSNMTIAEQQEWLLKLTKEAVSASE